MYNAHRLSYPSTQYCSIVTGTQCYEKLKAQLGCIPPLRKKENEIFVTDNGNYILDCKFDSIPSPETTHENLKQVLGVVETGLFVNMTHKVIIGEENEVKVLVKK